MQTEHSIGSLFATVAREFADFPAIALPDRVMTYARLAQITGGFCRRLRAIGVDRGSVVALNSTDIVVSVAVLLATAQLGCQFVAAGPNLARTKALRPTHFLRSAEMQDSQRIRYHLIDESWLPGVDEDDSPDQGTGEDCVDLEAPWLAMHTSGTTGTPKYLSLSQRIVLARTAAIAGDFPRGATTIAMLFGCMSRPFHARAIGALLNGGTIVAGTDVAHWRQWGVDYVCGSPLQAANLFRDTAPGKKFQRIETSGGRLSDEDAALLLDHFDTVIDIYGASETNKSFATVIERGADGAILRTGRPLDSEVQVVDRQGNPCPPGTAGTVRVRNPYLAPGYVGEPAKTAKSFRDGWFYPGDIGQWTSRGALEIIGREDDLISIGGVKVYATLIDLMISVVPGVREAICFKNPKASAANELLAFVKFDPLVNRADCTEAIRTSITERFGVMLPVGNIHAIDAIPRDENGKPLRALAQKMILRKVEQLAAAGEGR